MPGPPSTMKPLKKLLIWLEPAAAVELCRIVDASICPDKVEFSVVTTVNGDALLKVFREMRDPVTTTVSASRAGIAGQSAVAAVPGVVTQAGLGGAVCASTKLGINAIADSALAPRSEQRIETFKVNPQVMVATHVAHYKNMNARITTIS